MQNTSTTHITKQNFAETHASFPNSDISADKNRKGSLLFSGFFLYLIVFLAWNAITMPGDAFGNNVATTLRGTSCTPAFLSLTPSQTNASCRGGSDGTATVSATGGDAPYAYSWSGGGTNETKSGLAAGDYTVTVTDFNGREATQTFTITEPIALAVSHSEQVSTCSGSSTGSASVSATGGTGGYTYSWTGNASISNTATGLSAGLYTVTIMDGHGCTDNTTKIFSIVNATMFTYTGTGNWTVAGNWSPCYPGTTIPAGSTVVISTGSTVTVPTGTTVINNGTIGNEGTLSVSGGTFTNHGNYSGSGSFNGAIYINPPAGTLAPGD